MSKRSLVARRDRRRRRFSQKSLTFHPSLIARRPSAILFPLFSFNRDKAGEETAKRRQRDGKEPSDKSVSPSEMARAIEHPPPSLCPLDPVTRRDNARHHGKCRLITPSAISRYKADGRRAC